MSSSEILKVAANLSQEFEIRLVSNPSTAYVWQLQQYPKELQLLGDRYEQLQEPQAVGSPVNQIFTFQALEEGNYEVTFVLKRAWESTPIETCRFIVEVTRVS